jgi:hypothetical protein
MIADQHIDGMHKVQIPLTKILRGSMKILRSFVNYCPSETLRQIWQRKHIQCTLKHAPVTANKT